MEQRGSLFGVNRLVSEDVFRPTSRPQAEESLPCVRGGVTSSQTGDGRVVIYRSLTISQAEQLVQVTIPQPQAAAPFTQGGLWQELFQFLSFVPRPVSTPLRHGLRRATSPQGEARGQKFRKYSHKKEVLDKGGAIMIGYPLTSCCISSKRSQRLCSFGGLPAVL